MSFYERLSEDIKVRVLSHNNFKYVSASDVRDRLNRVFDCKWSFTVTDCIIDDDIVVVRAKIETELDDYRVTKESFGTGEIKRYSGGVNKGKPVDVGNAYQTAIADALKSCAKMLGIGNNISNTVSDSASNSYEKKEEKSPDVAEKIAAIKAKAKNSSNDTQESNGTEAKTKEDKQTKATVDKGVKKDKGSRDDVRARIAKKKKEASGIKKDESKDSKNDNDTDGIGGSGFAYSKDGADTLEIKKMILANFAVNKGIGVDEFVKKALGDDVTMDTITEEQISMVINGTMSDAVGG
jgi:hypothetical protein